MKNQDRFYILRGYVDSNSYHSQGGDGVTMSDLLRRMEFEDLDSFSAWYKSLKSEEIEEGKKDWCSGNCCQSILKTLLKLSHHHYTSKECPKCRSRKVLRMVYVLLAPGDLAENEYPAGCCVTGEDPLWHCGNCGWEWSPKASGAYNEE